MLARNLGYQATDVWCKGKVHLIEVLPDSSEEDESEQKPNGELHSIELEQLP